MPEFAPPTIPYPLEAHAQQYDIGAQFGLPAGAFSVERNVYVPAPTKENPFATKIVGKQVQEGGWAVRSRVDPKDPNDPTGTIVVLEEIATGKVKKDVPLKRVLSWQAPEKSAAEVPIVKSIGQAATSEQYPQALAKEDPITRAVRLHEAMLSNSGDFGFMFADTRELDDALAGLNPEQRKRYDQLMIERAARRVPGLWETLGSARKDGNNRILNEEQTQAIEASLSALGILSEKPSEDDIKAGVERAKAIVGRESAESVLRSKDFVDETVIREVIKGTRATFVRTDGTLLYMNPDMIIGGDSFDSWAGRKDTSMLKAVYDRNNVKQKLSSLEIIKDNATRDTALPALGLFDVEIILTKEGAMVALNGGTHRVAAAKLRGEPVGFSSFVLYDTRNK